MAGREGALEVFSANFLCCSKSQLRLESPFLLLESFTRHSPAHFVLLQAQPSRGTRSLLRNSSGRRCSGARAWGAYGPGSARGSKWERMPWQKRFCGAIRAAYQCSFRFWGSGAEAPQEAEEVTFWPPFCLSYLSGASQTPSWCLCTQGWVLPSAEHTQPCEHPLTPPGSGQTGLPGSVCT